MMSEPYFVKAVASETWHIIYPGEDKPVCGTRAALDDESGSYTTAGRVCASCRGNKRLSDDKVYIDTCHPEIVCTGCGARIDIPEWRHRHMKIWKVEDDE